VTLRLRVTAAAAVAVLAVLAGAGTGLVLAQRATLTDSLDESLADRASAAAAQLGLGRPVRLTTEDVTVRVVAGDGASSAAADATLPDGRDARAVTRAAGDATVVVTGSLEDVDDSVRVLRDGLLLAVPATTAVLAALVWLLTGRVLRPVDRIRAEVDRISAGRLDRRVPEPRTGDEVARLARTMNAMLDRLAAAADRQRRFVADAAHELRTPLARIRTQLEVDRAHPAGADQAATREAVLAEAGRLQRLVDDLLLLARGDGGEPGPGAARPVDLDDVVARQAALHEGPGPEVDLRGVAPAQVCGDEAALERAVANLLDNAVRHARRRVTVTLREEDRAVVLTVADDGPGIPPEARESVFERFTRLDDARSADGGGAGLGLAIARDVVVRHGGSLALDGASATGARFVAVLPAQGGVPPGSPG
jgi:signal transduction histidine kinase